MLRAILDPLSTDDGRDVSKIQMPTNAWNVDITKADVLSYTNVVSYTDKNK